MFPQYLGSFLDVLHKDFPTYFVASPFQVFEVDSSPLICFHCEFLKEL
jgi:hypothetical protein